jgi:AcrR family transcriptional regulator
MNVQEGPTSRQAQRLRTRERVLDAAIVEFQRTGTGSADINAIVEAAGVARSTFYFHFPTKEHVLLELIRRDELAWPRNSADTLTPRMICRAVLHTITDLVLARKPLGRSAVPRRHQPLFLAGGRRSTGRGIRFSCSLPPRSNARAIAASSTTMSMRTTAQGHLLSPVSTRRCFSTARQSSSVRHDVLSMFVGRALFRSLQAADYGTDPNSKSAGRSVVICTDNCKVFLSVVREMT